MVLSLGKQFIFNALGCQFLTERLYIQILFPLLHNGKEEGAVGCHHLNGQVVAVVLHQGFQHIGLHGGQPGGAHIAYIEGGAAMVAIHNLLGQLTLFLHGSSAWYRRVDALTPESKRS